MEKPLMNSSRPYLVRGLVEWIYDNNCTPYITVAADYPQIEIPRDYVREGKITLDISEVAVRQLVIDQEALTGDAKFGGKLFHLYIPVGAIIAVFAKETQEGMGFAVEQPRCLPARSPDRKTKARFTVVKND